MSAAEIGRRVVELEARALEGLAATLGPEFDAVVALIARSSGRLVCAGVGKSGHVARKIAATLSSTGTPALFVHPTEASHGDMGMIGRGDCVLALSKSGEVSEFGDLIAYTRRFAIPLIAITSNADSVLGRAADHRLMLPDAAEACAETRAPTTSTTLMMALGDGLAVALLEQRGFTADDFRVFHPGGKLGAMLKTVGDLMHGGDAMPLVTAETPMTEALLVMTEKRFGCAGVVDAVGGLLGIITDGDVRRRAGSDLLDKRAGDIMTLNPRTIAPGALAAEALNVMNAGPITVLFAVVDGKPAGIVHVHDLLRAGVV